jgi:hypothetical protein
MQISTVREGDVVKCNRRGRFFEARVTGKFRGGLNIEPLGRETYTTVKSTEVIDFVSKVPRR